MKRDTKKSKKIKNAYIHNFSSSEEVLQIIGELIGALQRGRTSLIIPKKKSIDDLMKGRNMVSRIKYFISFIQVYI